MDKDKLVQNFKPSELNNRFEYEHLNFSAYVASVTQMLLAVKQKFNLPVSDDKLLLNAPFEWHPQQPTRKGALLIHGLFDSPFMMRDIARHLCDQGFLVRSILLPGHGTVPADLMTTSSQEWVKATEYGVRSFKNEVDELYLVGFSTGATLSVNYILRNSHNDPKISGLILLSPALAINTFKSILIRIYRMFRWFLGKNRWVIRPGYYDYTKYTSFPVNAALMLQRIIVENKWLEKKQKLEVPIFIAVTDNDESVRPHEVLKFFAKTKNPDNRLIYYSNHTKPFSDHRITIVPSADLANRILNFSHVSLLISPTNAHYGKEGDYQEPIQEPQHKPASQDVYYGAFDTENEKKYRLRRITYNPKFSELMQAIDQFIISSSP